MHMGKMCGNVGVSSFLLLMIVYPCVFAVSENVAYRKRASMSSFTENHLACMAVNGDTTTVLKDSANCAESAHTDYNAWWAVDLGRKYNVSNIPVYRETSTLSGAVRMADLVLKVDNQLCFNFPTFNSANLTNLAAKIDIVCDPSITGQVIRLEKVNPYSDSDYYIITICEVQVWVRSLEGTTTRYAGSTTIHADTTDTQGDTTSSQRDTTNSQRDTASSQRETTSSQIDTTISYGISITNRAETTIIYETTTPNLTETNASDAQGAETNTAVIVGPVVGGVVLLMIIVLVVVIIVRRKQSSRRKHASDKTDKESGSSHHALEPEAPDKPLPFAPFKMKGNISANITDLSLAAGDASCYEQVGEAENKYDSLVPQDQRPDEKSVYTNLVVKDTAAGSGTTVYYENTK